MLIDICIFQKKKKLKNLYLENNKVLIKHLKNT